MALYRPSIPLEVRCRVAMRQLGEMWPDERLEAWRHDMTVAPAYRGAGFGALLDVLLTLLASLLNCSRAELRLDHNPALGLRAKRVIQQKGGRSITRYTPDANDPDHLLYRSHAAHHIKTNVRGDGAQFSDTALMKRERRRVKKKKRKAKFHVKQRRAIPARPWPKGRKLQWKR